MNIYDGYGLKDPTAGVHILCIGGTFCGAKVPLAETAIKRGDTWMVGLGTKRDPHRRISPTVLCAVCWDRRQSSVEARLASYRAAKAPKLPGF